MKAVEAKKIITIYKIESIIDNAARKGDSYVEVKIDPKEDWDFYKNIFDYFTDNEYDIYIDKCESVYVISWKNAKKGIKGVIKYVKLTRRIDDFEKA